MNCFKGQFPFKITVPSWLYPADYLENVSRVAPLVDGVELLFFEGQESSLPDAATWKGLLDLKGQHDLSYNIHMPTDENLSSLDAGERKRALDAHIRLMARVSHLSPETHTIHLQRPEHSGETAWLDAAEQSLVALANCVDPASITIETLDDSLFPLADVIETLGFYVCLDLGHLIHFGLPVAETIHRFAPRCRMIHLHGVSGGKDHRSLAEMDPAVLDSLLPFLSTYPHTLSMEIFKADPCFESIAILGRALKLKDT